MRALRRCCIATLLVAFSLAGQDRGLGGPREAIVHLYGVDTFGNPIPEAHVDSFRSEGGRDISSKFKGDVAHRVPYGTYRVNVRAPGFYPENRFIRVYQEQVFFTAGMEFGVETSLIPSELRGHIEGPLLEGRWVKLVGVFSAFSLEADVDSRGNFTMSGMPEGDYVLLTIRGKEILDERRLGLPILNNRQAPLIIAPKDSILPNHQVTAYQ